MRSFRRIAIRQANPVKKGDQSTIASVTIEADARLIAAAPDLLEKCEKIVRWLDKLAARSEESTKDRRFVSPSEAHQADAKNYRATADDIRAVIAKATGGEA
jgi:vacuolar-type H+-ATPase subunit E/Vma4